jgi:DnaJ-class molecular chaperone
MNRYDKCIKCSGKGYVLIQFPQTKEACFYCQGSGQTPQKEN